MAVEPAYGPADGGDAEWPGEFPFTRGLYPTGYRGRTWTIRQFAGFGNAEQTNERYRRSCVDGRRRPHRRLRHAHADGSRLRRPARASARSGTAASRSTAPPTLVKNVLFDSIPLRAGHHVDDDLAVPRCRCSACTWSPPKGRAPISASSTAPADRHLQGVHRSEGVVVPPDRTYVSLGTDGVLHGKIPAYKPLSISGYHIRELARPPRRSWPSLSPMASPTSNWAAPRLDADHFATA